MHSTPNRPVLTFEKRFQDPALVEERATAAAHWYPMSKRPLAKQRPRTRPVEAEEPRGLIGAEVGTERIAQLLADIDTAKRELRRRINRYRAAVHDATASDPKR